MTCSRSTARLLRQTFDTHRGHGPRGRQPGSTRRSSVGVVAGLLGGLFASLVASLIAGPVDRAWGEVTKVEIQQRTPYAEGREFPGVGAYETLRGKVTFEIDPAAEANRAIVDLDLAPKNAAGRVEFSADLEILAPVDRRRSRGVLLYDVNNRGNKLALGQFNGGGDDFLMRQGYVVVWSGWIAETAPGGGRLRLQAPVAHENGRPIVGRVRAEVVVDAPAPRANLGQWAHQGSYEPTERGELEATLTWRLRESDPRVPIPRSQWRFERRVPEEGGERGQLPILELVVSGGLQPGYLYEVIYEAQGSLVQGAGLAGIRDLVSFLKYDASPLNPLAVEAPGNAGGRRSTISHTIGFGVSQSGRCLRTLLYDGLNVDERGRRAFDGLMPHVAGAGIGFFNHRFASPTRHNAQHDNHLYPADLFPFAYGDDYDPLTDRTDGILRRSRAAQVVPKVMHTQSSSEYWHRAGSLVHTDPSSRRDATIPPEVRIYAFGGTQHGPGGGRPEPTATRGQLIGNPHDYRPLMRGLLTALEAWVVRDEPPPPSVYPRIADGSLADWRAASSGWRALAGVRYPEVIHQPALVDRGPEFLEKRRIALEPPPQIGRYDVRIPGYDETNRELGTLDLPCVAVPVGTATSWNLRHRNLGAETELLSLAGGYVPLARTADERRRAGDPRLSLEERYGTFDEYRRRHAAAARALVAGRYLLEEDLPRLEQLSGERRPLFGP